MSTNEFKCGNCNEIVPVEKNRSIWAQVIVWLLFIFAWPVTLIYYMINPKYKCSKCKKTFLGVKGEDGLYAPQKNGAAVVFIVLGILLGIAIIGILSSIVLASLSQARQKGLEAANKVTEIRKNLMVDLANELKSTEKFPVKIDNNTYWIDIAPKDDSIEYKYVIKGIDEKKLDEESIKTSSVNNICKSDNKMILDKDINIDYLYTVENSSTTIAFRVTKADCVK